MFATEATTIGQHLGELHQADFLALWTAARAIRAGVLATLPDAEAFRALQQAWVGERLESLHPWLYPPTALLVVWPLAFLPYLTAFAVWTAGTAIPYLAALRRAFPPSRVVVLAGLASPAAFMTAINGQSSFLTAALIGWGVLLLPRFPARAGALLGLLAFKPQMALCVPVALVAGRQGIALAACAAAAAAMSLVATACFGTGPWTGFFRVESPFAWTLMTDGRIGYQKVQSAFAAVRLLGGSMRLAIGVQAVVAAAAVVTIAWVWSRRSVPHELKAAALLSGGLVVSPYLLDYDMVTATIAIALVVAHALRFGFGRGELLIVSFVAVVPMVSRIIGSATHVNVGAASLLALYAVVLRRSWRAETAAAPSAAAPASAAIPG
jgi:hypothetical protein